MPGQEQLQRVQDTYFAETGEVLFTVGGEEGRFFRKGQSLLYPLQGYYVFYQANTAMQEYMTMGAQGGMNAVRLQKVVPAAESGRTQKAEETSAGTPPEPQPRPRERKPEPEPAAGGWQRRVVAAVLFVLLAAGIAFYGEPERARALQQQIADRLFGTEEALPAAGSASASGAEETEAGSEAESESESETQSLDAGTSAAE